MIGDMTILLALLWFACGFKVGFALSQALSERRKSREHNCVAGIGRHTTATLARILVLCWCAAASAAMLDPLSQPYWSAYLPAQYVYFTEVPQAALDRQFPQAITYGYQTPSLDGTSTINLIGYQLRPFEQPVITTRSSGEPFPIIDVVSSSVNPGVVTPPVVIPPAVIPPPSPVDEPWTLALVAIGLSVLLACKKQNGIFLVLLQLIGCEERENWCRFPYECYGSGVTITKMDNTHVRVTWTADGTQFRYIREIRGLHGKCLELIPGKKYDE